MTLGAAPSAIGWAQIANIVRHLPQDSAVWRAMHPEEAQWASGLATAHLLADLYDLVASFAWLFSTAHSKSKPRKPKRYPVPWAKGEERHIGKGAITIAEFDEWYYGGD